MTTPRSIGCVTDFLSWFAAQQLPLDVPRHEQLLKIRSKFKQAQALSQLKLGESATVQAEAAKTLSF